MKSVKVCEYSRSRSFHDDLILQDQALCERSQDQWSSGSFCFSIARLLVQSDILDKANLIIEVGADCNLIKSCNCRITFD